MEEVEKPAAADFDSVRLDMSHTAVKEIKILGPGCAKCKATYQVIMKVINENNLDVQLTKIEDIDEIMSYNIMSTPAVVVDGVVKIKGHVPSESEVKQILGNSAKRIYPFEIKRVRRITSFSGNELVTVPIAVVCIALLVQVTLRMQRYKKYSG